MDQKEFDDLYQYYAVNKDTLSNLEYMQTHDDWSGLFVHDMWRMIEFIKSDPMLQAFKECAAIIEAAQQSVQADACYCCRDGGCQAGCRCQEFVGDAD